jgi:hypothetical protein
MAALLVIMVFRPALVYAHLFSDGQPDVTATYKNANNDPKKAYGKCSKTVEAPKFTEYNTKMNYIGQLN